jgi:hypothetical protein
MSWPIIVCLHLAMLTSPLPAKPMPKYAPISKVYHVASVASAMADTGMTLRDKVVYGGFDEYDPVARPIVALPNPAYVAVSVAMVVGWNILADKANESPRFHKVARPMLWLQTAASTYGFGSTFYRTYRYEHK